MQLQRLLHRALNSPYFSSDTAASLHVSYQPGDSRLLVLTGDNATGKSFFLRLYQALCYQSKIECLRVGMERRTQGGMERVFMYGDESWDSTGNISAKCLLGGIQTCKNRKNPHYIIFDEPDTGLSEGYQYAMGLYIAKFMDELPKKTKGVFISTHSRYLARPLLEYHPHHLRFGDTSTLAQWAEQEPKLKSLEDLLSLKEKAHQRFLRIRRIIDGK